MLSFILIFSLSTSWFRRFTVIQLLSSSITSRFSFFVFFKYSKWHTLFKASSIYLSKINTRVWQFNAAVFSTRYDIVRCAYLFSEMVYNCEIHAKHNINWKKKEEKYLQTNTNRSAFRVNCGNETKHETIQKAKKNLAKYFS